MKRIDLSQCENILVVKGNHTNKKEKTIRKLREQSGGASVTIVPKLKGAIKNECKNNHFDLILIFNSNSQLVPYNNI